MFTSSLARTLGIVFGVGTFLLFSSPAFASANLLTNPGAESDGTGWITLSNGGDGMSYNFDGIVRTGTQSFQTSHVLDNIYQTVDLFANGYSANSMASQPSISFSVWLTSRPDQGANYYVKFSLLQADGTTVVTSTNFGSPSSLINIAAGSGWFEKAHTFSGYGAGVRYVSIEFGGRDDSGWAGNYGPHFDDASITIDPATVTDAGGGGNTMPSWGFVPPRGPFDVRVHNHPSAMVQTSDVSLDLSASSDVDRMAISRYSDFHDSGITSFVPTIPWTICQPSACQPGVYDVYAKFYQAYGVASPVQHLVITYTPQVVTSNDAQSFTYALHSDEAASSPSSSANTAPPFVFMRDLRQGDQGEDVKRLQEFMNAHGYVVATEGSGSLGNETIVFGPGLRRAVARFQEAHAERLLVPLSLKKGTGAFGSRTRAIVNEEIL